MGQFLFRNCVRERKIGSFAGSRKAKNVWAGALAGLMFSVAIFGVMPSGGASALDGHIGHGALGGQAQITPRADDKIIYTTSEGVSVKSQNNNLYTTLDGKVYGVLGQGDGGSTYYVDGYIQKEYIEGTGTQYIDTNFLHSPTTDVEIDFSVNASNSRYAVVMGSRGYVTAEGFWKNCFIIGATDNYSTSFYFSRDTGANSTSELFGSNDCPADTLINFVTSGFSVVWQAGNITCTYNYINYYSSNGLYPCYIFTFNDGGSLPYDGFFKGKVYCCKIWDNGVLVRDFVPVQCPCKKSIGLYDKVNKVLYENQGTGSFLVGGNAVPEEVVNAPVYDNFSYVSDNLAEDLHYRTVEGFEMIGGVERGYLLCQSQVDESYLKIRI